MQLHIEKNRNAAIRHGFIACRTMRVEKFHSQFQHANAAAQLICQFNGARKFWRIKGHADRVIGAHGFALARN